MGRTDQVRDFQAFNFEGDERWNTYLKSIELLNNDAGTLLRAKGRWYKKTIDVNFDLTWLADVQPGAGAAPAASPASRAATFMRGGFTSNSSGTANAGSEPTPRAGGTAGAPPPRTAPAPQRGQPNQLALLVYHALVVGLAVAAIVMPFAYATLMKLLIIGSLYKLGTAHGLPPVWPFRWPVLQQYLAGVAAAPAMHTLLLGVLFRTMHPIGLVPMVVAAPAAYEVAAALSRTASHTAAWQRYGSRLHSAMMAKQRDVQVGCALGEIAIGGLLIVSLAGRNRNLMATYIYWNLLKQRYWVGESAAHHRVAWYTIGQRTAAIRGRIGLVDKGIGFVQKWFLNPR